MISLIEKGKIIDLQGNILTSSQQSVQNWTPAGSGSVDLSYADGVNQFEFSNYGTSGAKARFIEEYRQIYNVTMPNAWAEYILVRWESKGAYTSWSEAKYLYTALDGGGDYFVFVQCNDPNRILQNGKLQVNYGDHLLTVYKTQLAEDRVSTYYNDASGTFQLSGAHAWGSYEDWLSSITKNYTLSFDLSNGEFTPPSTLQEVKDWYASYGYTNIDNRIQTLYNYSTQNKVYLLFVDGNKVMFACTRRKSQDSYWELNIDNGNTWVYQKINGTIQWDVPSCWDCGTYVDNTYTYQTGAISSTGIVATGFAMSANSKIYVSDKDYIPDGNYLLSLLTRSTTGFTKDASKHGITLTNGNNTYTLEINPTASQEYQQQSILFTPTSASCSLKLDLSGMQGSGIELDIKDIGVYEIGGEA